MKGLDNRKANLLTEGKACIRCLKDNELGEPFELEDRDGWKVCSENCLEESNKISLEEEKLQNKK